MIHPVTHADDRLSGHPEAIDKVIPKTYEDVENERKAQLKSVQDLYTNMTIAMNDIQGLKQSIAFNNNMIRATDIRSSLNIDAISSNITALSNQIAQLQDAVKSLNGKP
jgi:hypothetical protein